MTKQDFTSEIISMEEHAYNLQLQAYTLRAQYRSEVDKFLSLCETTQERCDCYHRLLTVYNKKVNSDTWAEHSAKTFGGFAIWHILNGGWAEDSDKAIYDGFVRNWASSQVVHWITQEIHQLRQGGVSSFIFSELTPWNDGKSPNSIVVSSESIADMMEWFPQDDGSHGEAEEVYIYEREKIIIVNPTSFTNPAIVKNPESTILVNKDTEAPLTITILSIAQEKIFKSLASDTKPLVDTNTHNVLKNLLKGENIDDYIVINYQMNAFVHLFRLAIEANEIQSNKTSVRDWLCYWFRIKHKNQVKRLSPRSVYDWLTKEMTPTKNKRLPYKS